MVAPTRLLLVAVVVAVLTLTDHTAAESGSGSALLLRGPGQVEDDGYNALIGRLGEAGLNFVIEVETDERSKNELDSYDLVVVFSSYAANNLNNNAVALTTTPVLVLGHLEAAKTAGLVANTTDALVNSGVPSLFTVLGNSTLTGSQPFAAGLEVLSDHKGVAKSDILPGHQIAVEDFSNSSAAVVFGTDDYQPVKRAYFGLVSDSVLAANPFDQLVSKLFAWLWRDAGFRAAPKPEMRTGLFFNTISVDLNTSSGVPDGNIVNDNPTTEVTLSLVNAPAEVTLGGTTTLQVVTTSKRADFTGLFLTSSVYAPDMRLRASCSGSGARNCAPGLSDPFTFYTETPAITAGNQTAVGFHTGGVISLTGSRLGGTAGELLEAELGPHGPVPFAWVSETEAVVTIPDYLTAEAVALTLHTQFGGSSNKFSIRVLNPVLQAVEPSFGPRDSQNLITISGSELGSQPGDIFEIRVANVSCPIASFPPFQVVCTLGGGLPYGTHELIIEGVYGTISSPLVTYSVFPPPVITSIDPDFGAAASGIVTIYGDNLDNLVLVSGESDATVTIGSVDATIEGVSPSELNVSYTGLSPGSTLSLRVKTASSVGQVSNSAEFRVGDRCTILSVNDTIPGVGAVFRVGSSSSFEISGLLLGFDASDIETFKVGAFDCLDFDASGLPNRLGCNGIAVDTAGLYGIEVQTLSGNSTCTLPNAIYAVLEPTVDKIDPGQGPPQGGAIVTVTGEYLGLNAVDLVAVTFNSEDCVPVDTSGLPTKFTCRVPPLVEEGDVDIYVRTASGGGMSFNDVYANIAEPYLMSLTPSFGDPNGGYLVNFTGYYLDTEPTEIDFRDGFCVPQEAPHGLNVDPGLLQWFMCLVNSQEGGIVVSPDALVSGSQTVYTHVTFTFATEPVLEYIYPDFLPPGGGVRVTITGTFLDSAVAPFESVTIGGELCSNPEIQEGPVVECTSPALPALEITYPVVVINAFGPSVPLGVYILDRPFVTSISPTVVPFDFDGMVTITGSGFRGTECDSDRAAVHFDGVYAEGSAIDDNTVEVAFPGTVAEGTYRRVNVTNECGVSQVPEPRIGVVSPLGFESVSPDEFISTADSTEVTFEFEVTGATYLGSELVTNILIGGIDCGNVTYSITSFSTTVSCTMSVGGLPVGTTTRVLRTSYGDVEGPPIINMGPPVITDAILGDGFTTLMVSVPTRFVIHATNAGTGLGDVVKVEIHNDIQSDGTPARRWTCAVVTENSTVSATGDARIECLVTAATLGIVPTNRSLHAYLETVGGFYTVPIDGVNVTICNDFSMACDACLSAAPTCSYCPLSGQCNGGFTLGSTSCGKECPRVDAITPSVVLTEGGAFVTVTGAGFSVLSESDFDCDFGGGMISTEVTFVGNNTAVSCQAQARPAGTHNFTLLAGGNPFVANSALPVEYVECEDQATCEDCAAASEAGCGWCIATGTCTDGLGVCSASLFATSAAVCPRIDAVAPTSYPADGGYNVTVTGANFPAGLGPLDLQCVYGLVDTKMGLVRANGTQVICPSPVVSSGRTSVEIALRVVSGGGYLGTQTAAFYISDCEAVDIDSCGGCVSEDPHCNWCNSSSICAADNDARCADGLLSICPTDPPPAEARLGDCGDPDAPPNYTLLIIYAGVGTVSAVMSIVSWCLDKESSKTIMVVTTIGLLDLVSDVLFVLTLNDYAFILGFAFIGIPVFINVVMIVFFIISEAKQRAFGEYLDEHSGMFAVVVVFSAFNLHTLNIIDSKIFGLRAFAAPVSDANKRRLKFAGLSNTLFEDLPQLALLILVTLDCGRLSNVALGSVCVTAVAVIIAVVKRLIDCVAIKATKGASDDDWTPNTTFGDQASTAGPDSVVDGGSGASGSDNEIPLKSI